ncbi:MAG: molybdopterin dinucleotide binding domain-containing protein, partial [Nitrospinota bacterium]|nr:molybdopterin dinucleotide binding domain-containing protein [Nitrospinota bacterium]
TGPNLQGAMDMGCLPYAFPGYRPVGRDDALFEAGVLRYPDWTGLDAQGILAAVREGRIKALYLMGADPVRDFPDPEAVRAALDGLEFLVVQDSLPNFSAAYADIVLPVGAPTEIEGTVTGVGRHVQGLDVAVRPSAGVRPDWEIIGELMGQFGAPTRFDGLGAVQEEIEKVISAYAGIGNGGPEKGGFRWAAEALPPDRAVPGASGAADAGGAMPGASGAGGLRLLTSPQIFSTGAMAAESKAIRAAGPQAYAEIHPEAAAALGISEGEVVSLASSRGEISVPAHVDRKTPPGAVYVPSGAGDCLSNVLLSAGDPVPAVTLERRAG